VTLTLDAPAERRTDLQAAWKLAGAIVGQTAILTALLLYFGWARTKTTYGYFGIDVSLLDQSTTDFVLNSVNSAYNPLLRLGLVALVALGVHEVVTRSRARASRVTQLAILSLGLALFAIGTSALLWTAWSRQIGHWVPDEPGLAFAWLPVTLAASFALLAYACTTPLVAGRLRAPLRLSAVLVGLCVLAAFWAVSLFAVHDGLARAKAIEADLSRSTEVVLVAQQPLAIRGPGVVASDLRGRYTRSYAGLRLLKRAGGKFFLLPVGWHHGSGHVFAVPDDGQVRIELIAH
jgi:hypothetical protein